MRRIIIVGAGGYLGTAVTLQASKTYKVLATFRNRSCPIKSSNIDHVLLDFSKKAMVEDFQRIIQNTDLVVVASNVEYGHPDELTLANYESFLRVLAFRGIKTVYVSSDAVFDGKRQGYTEESVPTPITDYGRRKLRAERIIGNGSNVIIRTSYIYGSNGYCIDKRLLELHKAAKEDHNILRYRNMIRNPIHIHDLAKAILLLTNHSGVYHVAGPAMSTYSFTQTLAHKAGISVKIKEIELTEPEVDHIPLNTNLTSNRLQGLGIRIPSLYEKSDTILSEVGGELRITRDSQHLPR